MLQSRKNYNFLYDINRNRYTVIRQIRLHLPICVPNLPNLIVFYAPILLKQTNFAFFTSVFYYMLIMLIFVSSDDSNIFTFNIIF